jgi:hypothetical protein
MEKSFKVKFAYMGSIIPTVIKHNNEVPQKRFESLFIEMFVDTFREETFKEHPDNKEIIEVWWKHNLNDDVYEVFFDFPNEEDFTEQINKYYGPGIISNYMQFIYKEYEDIDLEKDATTIYYNFEDELVMVYFQTLKDYQKDSSYVIKKELYKKFEPVLLI